MTENQSFFYYKNHLIYKRQIASYNTKQFIMVIYIMNCFENSIIIINIPNSSMHKAIRYVILISAGFPILYRPYHE